MYQVRNQQTCYLFVFVFAILDVFGDFSFQGGDSLHSLFNSIDLWRKINSG